MNATFRRHLASAVMAFGVTLIAGGTSAMAMRHPRLWPFSHQVDYALIAVGTVFAVFAFIAAWREAER